MFYVCLTIAEFEEKSATIQAWMVANVAGYSGTIWAVATDWKHHAEDKWLLKIPEDCAGIFGPIETTEYPPKGWFKKMTA